MTAKIHDELVRAINMSPCDITEQSADCVVHRQIGLINGLLVAEAITDAEYMEYLDRFNSIWESRKSECATA